MQEVPNAVDHHSFAKPEESIITHLNLDLKVDFSDEVITGIATYLISSDSSAEKIILDVNHLSVDSIFLLTNAGRKSAQFSIGPALPHVGSPLSIELSNSSPRAIEIHYRTTDNALALQWLQPQQTLEKKHPFLFTQGQAILTRTWIPVQDSPGIRFTYNATVQVPADLMAVMSATNPQAKNESGIYSFEMIQPIPAYLMALAVGDITFKAIGERTGVYAEPGMLDASAHEMADLDKMVIATEEIYGPYLWDRYDLIVLPPSFPFGGMENPRLTFATPTIIAGDRSLTALVAHELAHSWSGNLVTNATWDDFWLNEGHTVYLERRIMEILYGRDYAEMLALLGFQDLTNTVNDLGENGKGTHLKLDLKDVDPDEGMNDIAYEKGYLLLRTLEDKVGRENFDRFLKNYFEKYKFKSLSTEQWEAYTQYHLLDSLEIDFDLKNWLYGPGIPENHSQIVSDKFKRVDGHLATFVRLGRLDRSTTRAWSTHEWLHFIRQIPTDLHESFYEKLDEVFKLSASGNSEIIAAWLEKSIRSDYFKDHNQDRLEDFLINVGRRKFLMPLYRALKETGELDLAKRIFEKAVNNYHSVSANSIRSLLDTDPLAI